ncbi:MAG: hypothetical protein ABL934_07055 [Lysobacteraceae bacterium]
MRSRATVIFIAGLLLAACKPSAPVADAQLVTTAAVDASKAAPASAAVAEAPVPAPEAVLRDIFKQPITAAENAHLTDGRYAGYWSGHRFELDGKRYFVGFAESTGETEIEYPTEDNTVTLSQATYVFDNGAWTLRGTQTGIGMFGSFEKPPQIDSEAAPQAMSVGGRYFVGMPTVEVAMAGARLDFYELFAFAPRELEWTYLGYVAGGRDTRAGCTSDTDLQQPVKCAASTAKLKFAPAAGNDWPAVTVAFDGDVVGADGEVRKATEQDAVEYRFDAASGSYSKILR